MSNKSAAPYADMIVAKIERSEPLMTMRWEMTRMIEELGGRALAGLDLPPEMLGIYLASLVVSGFRS